jgi:hypothetical protein
MIRLLRWLLNPCLLGHPANPLYGRNQDGALVWTCARCHAVIWVVLAGEDATGAGDEI